MLLKIKIPLFCRPTCPDRSRFSKARHSARSNWTSPVQSGLAYSIFPRSPLRITLEDGSGNPEMEPIVVAPCLQDIFLTLLDAFFKTGVVHLLAIIMRTAEIRVGIVATFIPPRLHQGIRGLDGSAPPFPIIDSSAFLQHMVTSVVRLCRRVLIATANPQHVGKGASDAVESAQDLTGICLVHNSVQRRCQTPAAVLHPFDIIQQFSSKFVADESVKKPGCPREEFVNPGSVAPQGGRRKSIQESSKFGKSTGKPFPLRVQCPLPLLRPRVGFFPPISALPTPRRIVNGRHWRMASSP